MLKLLQEVREFDEFPARRTLTRSAGPLLLATRPYSTRNTNAKKRFIRIQAHQRLDIPEAVPISFLGPVEPQAEAQDFINGL